MKMNDWVMLTITASAGMFMTFIHVPVKSNVCVVVPEVAAPQL